MSQDSPNFFDPLDTPAPKPEPPKPPEMAIVPAPQQQYDLRKVGDYQLRPMQLPVQVTKEQELLLNQSLKDYTLHGIDVAALTCRGEGTEGLNDRGEPIWIDAPCPILNKCFIYKNLGAKALPLKTPCPIERAVLDNFIHMVAREMEIDPEDPINHYDITLISQRAMLKIVMNRAMIFMGEQPMLEQIIETDNGKFKTKLIKGNLNFEYYLKALIEDRKVADAALLTRRSKVQVLRSGFKDKSKQAAELQTRIRRQIDSTEKNIKLDPKTGLPTELTEITRFTKDPIEKDDGS